MLTVNHLSLPCVASVSVGFYALFAFSPLGHVGNWDKSEKTEKVEGREGERRRSFHRCGLFKFTSTLHLQFLNLKAYKNWK